jgi:hypothetical protein
MPNDNRNIIATLKKINLLIIDYIIRNLEHYYNRCFKFTADSSGQRWKEHALPLHKIVAEGGAPEGLCFESGHGCKTG